ncbi:MAG TPA: hypothetical protein VJG29_00705 [Candidatus Paceibacterota bacterium]
MTRALSSDMLTRASALLASLLVLSIVAYGVFILLMVQETAYRVRAESSIRALTGELGNLEGAYLLAEESVTLERAQALGFVEAKNIARVTRSANAPSGLSLRDDLR